MRHIKFMAIDRKNNIKKDYIWNTIGSSVYALSSMFLAFAAMHIAGAEDGGIFGFGFSAFGQQMFIIAYFGIRPFHITDSSYEYSYRDYRSLRRLTVIIAAAAAAIYLACMSASGGYSLRKSMIIFMLALYKIADGIADLYESECQRTGVLWIGGMELTARTVLAAGVLTLAMILTKDLLTASMLAVLAQFACIFVFKYYAEHKVFGNVNAAAEHTDTGNLSISTAENPAGSHNSIINDSSMQDAAAATIGTYQQGLGRIRSLFDSTWLLFISVFIDFYIFSASKYAIDRFLNDEASGIFNILFMPTSVIYLAANFVIRPYMTRLSALYESRDMEEFGKITAKLLKAVLLLSAAALLGSIILGRPCLYILELLLGNAYSGVLTAQSTAFVLIILGGCFYAVTCLYYYILIIMRRQKLIFIIYLIVAAAAFIMSYIAVPGAGIFGAAAVYPCYMAVSAVIFMAVSRKYMHSGKL